MANLSIERPNAFIEYFNKSKYSVNASINKRDIFLARAREKDKKVKVLFIDKFKELFKTLNILYFEIVKLITKTKNLYTNYKNYKQ